jgi:hypothetical protein
MKINLKIAAKKPGMGTLEIKFKINSNTQNRLPHTVRAD